jgi:hypothetical protein
LKNNYINLRSPYQHEPMGGSQETVGGPTMTKGPAA